MDITPLAQDLWEGIGGHFDSISQVVCEFVDNSISNFEARSAVNRTIYIEAEERDGWINIKIEDAGTGIEDLQASLRIGDKSVRQTPLNEHGFGLKHALASANPDNNRWKIYTRTKEDVEVGIYRVISAPYTFELEAKEISQSEEKWPGYFNSPGTLVEFDCTRTFFDTIQLGIRGYAQFQRCLEYLIEELGYVYSGAIEEGKVNIVVASPSIDFRRNVPAVQPEWLGYYKPEVGEAEVDLGGGTLTIEYKFGEMAESKYVKYYKRNESTSGVEIRVNGRLLVNNLFKKIWGVGNHPSYNHFLAIINLVTQNRDTLPRTRTSKNGIRVGDKKLQALYEWIRKAHPKPHRELSGAVSERELVKELAKLKEQHIRSQVKHIETDFQVFKNIGSPVQVDLYLFDGSEVVLYEAKKDTADVQSVYQLLMYWDGAVSDGLDPAEGILLASSFSGGVEEVVQLFSQKTDEEGNNYRFVMKTWTDEGIPYPKP
jgi:hypothetical protein